MRTRTLLRAATGGALALALVPAASAPAAQTFGQAATNPPLSIGSCDIGTATTLVSRIDDYRAPADGVITELRSRYVAFTKGVGFSFRVFRDVNAATVKGVATVPATTVEGGHAAVAARVPVKQGDRLGLSDPASANLAGCVFGTGVYADQLYSPYGSFADGVLFSVAPNHSSRVNVAATIEPDADADGFGDETQDGCDNDPARQGACAPAESQGTTPAQTQTTPTPPPPPTTTGETRSVAPKLCTVPKLRGLTIKKARRKLRRAGCTPGKARGKGRVRKQSLPHGTRVVAGTKVRLTLKRKARA